MTDEQAAELLQTMKSIDFWLGAVASNMQMLVRLEAKRQGISCEWHDPTGHSSKHGKSAEIDTIKVFVPRGERAK